MKSDAYYIELYCGFIIGIIFSITFYFWGWNIFKTLDEAIFLDKLIDVTAIIFGFLITVLALIIQSNSNTIEAMKKYGSFRRLIKFNRRVVIISGSLSLYSLVILAFQKIAVYNEIIVHKFIFSFLLLFLIWLIIDGLIFLIIFYNLLLKDSK